MKHLCSFEKSPDTVFRKSVSFLFNGCCKSGIFGNPWFPHQLSPTYFCLERVQTCIPTIYFPYCYVKYIIGTLSPELPPYIRPANAKTISTLISHPFKEKAKIKLYKIKMKIKSKSKYTKVQPLIFFASLHLHAQHLYHPHYLYHI